MMTAQDKTLVKIKPVCVVPLVTRIERYVFEALCFCLFNHKIKQFPAVTMSPVFGQGCQIVDVIMFADNEEL